MSRYDELIAELRPRRSRWSLVTTANPLTAGGTRFAELPDGRPFSEVFCYRRCVGSLIGLVSVCALSVFIASDLHYKIITVCGRRAVRADRAQVQAIENIGETWWRRLDSNQRPTDYETVALAT
jgi:hypothetical protein